MPLVSIVMRSMNDAGLISATLDAIGNQEFRDFEMLNVDSSSTDGTFEIIRRYNPDNSCQIAPESYIPGKVLNSAIDRCRGQIIVFNNSDCIPRNPKWLGNLIRPLQEDEQVVAAFGNQEPRPDARPLVRKDYRRAFGDGTLSANWQHFFSLATAAAKADVLRTHKFAENLQYSEDVEWSYRMKQLGFKIVYVPDAVVEHSHNYTLPEVWKRFYQEGLAEGGIYGSGKPFFRGFLIPWLAESARDFRFLIRDGQWRELPYGIVYRFCQRFAAWRGRHACFSSAAGREKIVSKVS